MDNAVRTFRPVLFVFGLAAIAALAYSAFSPGSAIAQSGPEEGRVIKSAGPIMLNGHESALIGLLLPAVQRVRDGYHLRLFDSVGNTLIDIPVIAMGDGSVRTAFFDIFFADGSVRVVDHQTGRVLLDGMRSDGIFSAVLLPAVQHNGHRVGALSASIQILDSTRLRKEVIGMCDGSV